MRSRISFRHATAALFIIPIFFCTPSWALTYAHYHCEFLRENEGNWSLLFGTGRDTYKTEDYSTLMVSKFWANWQSGKAIGICAAISARGPSRVDVSIHFVDGELLKSQGDVCEYSGNSVLYTSHRQAIRSDRGHLAAQHRVEAPDGLYEFLVFTGIRPEPFLTNEDVSIQCDKHFREHMGVSLNSQTAGLLRVGRGPYTRSLQGLR